MSFNLSVCIPTYNRYKYLKEILDETLVFMLKHDIEVCISNNASTDETDSYLIDLVARYPKVKYKLQKSNVGIDHNMIDVINMAKNEYVLAMGDDDMLIIDNLFEELVALDKKPDLLILNGLYNKQREHLSKDLKGAMFTDKNGAFDDLWKKMPFGSFILKKELFKEAYYQKYIGTSHAYTGVIWDALSSKNDTTGHIKIICGEKPLINFMDVSKTWRKDAFKIMYYEIPLWFKLLQPNYSVIERKDILYKHLNNQSTFSNFLTYRSNDTCYKENIRKYMGAFSEGQVMKANLIGLVPPVLAKIIMGTLNSIKKGIKWIIH